MCDWSVSVVIPLYNKERQVGRCIESVLSQYYPAVEVLVVDDCSTDESVMRVNEYDSVRLIQHSKNQGVSAARNTAMKLAVGTYIAFLDADDEWLPWHLEELHRCWVFSGGRQSLLATTCIPWREQGLLVDKPARVNGQVREVILAAEFAKQNFSFNSSTIALPRSMLKKVGFFREGSNYGEDLNYWLRVGAHIPSIVTTTICGLRHYDDQGSLMAQARGRKSEYINFLYEFDFLASPKTSLFCIAFQIEQLVLNFLLNRRYDIRKIRGKYR